MNSRRKFLMGSTAVAAALTVSACGQTPTDVVATVTQIIQKVQEGVRDACTAAGKLIPTAETVISVLASVIGVVFVGVGDVVKVAQAVISQVINIIAQACAATPPAAGVKMKAKGAKGEAIDIAFY